MGNVQDGMKFGKRFPVTGCWDVQSSNGEPNKVNFDGDVHAQKFEHEPAMQRHSSSILAGLGELDDLDVVLVSNEACVFASQMAIKEENPNITKFFNQCLPLWKGVDWNLCGGTKVGARESTAHEINALELPNQHKC